MGLNPCRWPAQALECYTAIVRRHPGLAVTEYARLGRALMLFQTGQGEQAILQLDDLVVTFVGCVPGALKT